MVLAFNIVPLIQALGVVAITDMFIFSENYSDYTNNRTQYDGNLAKIIVIFASANVVMTIGLLGKGRSDRYWSTMIWLGLIVVGIFGYLALESYENVAWDDRLSQGEQFSLVGTGFLCGILSVSENSRRYLVSILIYEI